MLLNLREYHRPAAAAPDRALAHALELLARPGIRTALLAGGATLLASADPAIEAVVDLQGMNLDFIRSDADDGSLRIGALATRAALADHEIAQSLYAGLIAEAARRWGGSVQRNRATIGAAIATAAANDPLLAALLACDAAVVLAERSGASNLTLAEFLAQRPARLAAPAIIIELRVPRPEQRAGGALATVARTPADAPIVVAAATVQRAGDRCAAAGLALGGVADAPLDRRDAVADLVGRPWTAAALAEAAGRAAADLQPPDDFRGSAAYRRAMAETLAARALRAAWEQAA